MMFAALATSECNSIKLIKAFESGAWLGGGGVSVAAVSGSRFEGAAK
jgi:hypothetical protein